MKKSLTAALAALTFGGAIAATAAPAQARDHGYYRGGYGYGYDRHHRHNGANTAIVAGVAGLAIGAAIAGSNHNGGGYNRGYAYNDGYYRDGYRDGYYGDRYYSRSRYVARTCESSRWVWDPYIRERVLVRSRYAC